MPAAAVFADTHAEPYYVYEQLQKLRNDAPFPIVTVDGGNLETDSLTIRTALDSDAQYVDAKIPAYYTVNGRRMMIQRRCTRNYKIVPIRRFARRYFTRGVVQWIGISTDEAQRMRDSDVGYIQNRYPLIELAMSRADCINYLIENGHDVPRKSACYFCPFHSTAHWKKLKNEEPDIFLRAVNYERRMQEVNALAPSRVTTPYLSYLKQPLDTIDFDKYDDRDGFGNECEGVCGV